MEADVAGLKDRAHRDSELFAAGGAFPEAPLLVLEEVRLALRLATVRTHRAVRPPHGLQVLGGLDRVLETLVVDVQTEVFGGGI